MQKEIITDCVDLLAGFEYMANNEQIQAFKLVIDALGSYPNPTKKGEPNEVDNDVLGAYLFVCNVRNACKLGAIGLLDALQAQQIAKDNLMLAFSYFGG